MAAPAGAKTTVASLRLVETRGRYDAGANGASPAMPQRAYTEFYNDCLEIAYGELSLSAVRCLLFIVRQTDGFHRDEVTLTLTDLCEGMPRRDGTRGRGTNLSRPSAMSGLEELRIAGILTWIETGRGRGRVRIYRLCSPDQWRIGKESLPITTTDHIDKETLPIDARIGKRFLPITANIGKKLLPLRNKEIKQKTEKERSAATSAAGPTSAPVVKREKIPPEEAEWRANTLKAIHAANDGHPTDARDREWAAAGKLYRCLGPGKGPPDGADIARCFAITRKAPRYDTSVLKLFALVDGPQHYLAYVRSGVEAYTKGIQRSRNGANGKYEEEHRTNGYRRSNPGAPAAPDSTRHGIYAKFVKSAGAGGASVAANVAAASRAENP